MTAKNWFPVAHAWPDIDDGREWSGACAASLTTVRITPSATHPGYFDYSITDISAGEVAETAKPVSAAAMPSFLEREGIDPAKFTWTARERANA